MKTRIVTEQEGEWFTDGTPAEWFAVHTASAARSDGHRDLTDAQKDIVRLLVIPPPAGHFWVVQTNGGYWHRLWTVGLYDGWPFWRKRVCVGTDGPIPGMHEHSGYDLEACRLAVPNTEPHAFHDWKFAEVTP